MKQLLRIIIKNQIRRPIREDYNQNLVRRSSFKISQSVVQAGHCGRFQYLTVVVKVLRRQTYQKVARVIAKQAEQSATCIKKAGGTADLLGRDPDMPPQFRQHSIASITTSHSW